jgi:hypothetical protein
LRSLPSFVDTGSHSWSSPENYGTTQYSDLEQGPNSAPLDVTLEDQELSSGSDPGEEEGEIPDDRRRSSTGPWLFHSDSDKISPLSKPHDLTVTSNPNTTSIRSLSISNSTGTTDITPRPGLLSLLSPSPRTPKALPGTSLGSEIGGSGGEGPRSVRGLARRRGSYGFGLAVGGAEGSQPVPRALEDVSPKGEEAISNVRTVHYTVRWWKGEMKLHHY